jgi:phosphoribosyl 1,2-cyclic phosphodiesterase
MLNVKVIASGSSGNCYVIQTSAETLMLECGLNIKSLLNSVDYKLTELLGCLVTHEHKDHSKGAADLAGLGVVIYASMGTHKALNVPSHRTYVVEDQQQFIIGKFIVMPFKVQHDAAEPMGYLIYHPEFGKLLFATDTYYIKYKFKNLNYIMVECNYSKEILEKNIESGALNPFMKKRLLSSHFSLENFQKFLAANDLTNLEEIYMIHLSAGNSHAEQFKEVIQRQTGKPVIIC